MKRNKFAFGLLAAGLLAFGASAASADALDRITFRSGNVVVGEIISETDSEIRVRVIVAGIAGETTYLKRDILSIEHDVVASNVPSGAATPAPGRPALAGDTAAVRDSNVKTVYRIRLDGEFGVDISETPIREAVKDAQRYQPDYLIIELENRWDEGLLGGLAEAQLSDDTAAFDQLWRAEDMEPIFTREIPTEWEKPPKIIFWVRNAMGGAAFLPLICPDIYMSSQAKIGGVGNIDQLFDGVGDEVVREKQRSLRMGHARGMAIQGGYDTRLVKAMCQMHYVLSYRLEGGKPVYFERMPEGPQEVLLTDSGENEEADSMEMRARNQGNDVLTINARIASDLGVSKGTVDTFEDLIFALGIARNHQVIEGRANAIIEAWKTGIANYKRDGQRILREYGEIQVNGENARERNRQRSQQIRKLEELLALINKYKEAIDPREYEFPDPTTLRIQIIQLRLQMLLDR